MGSRGAPKAACSYASFSYCVSTLSTSPGEGVREGFRAPSLAFCDSL